MFLSQLNKEQKELLEKFDALDSGKSTPKSNLFWDNLKKIFE